MFFPAVGILTGGAVAYAIIAARAFHLPFAAASVAGIVVGALITGCFHEDGFADTADAMGVSSRERSLEVMRDSRIGTFGAVALWILLSMKAALFSCLVRNQDLVAILIAAHALARWSSLPLLLFTPDARKGPGLGSGLAGLISARDVVLGTAVMFAIVAWVCGIQPALLLTAGSIVVVTVCGLFFRYRFGGVTGDCLGAANQVVELAVITAAFVAPDMLLHRL
jgi:adenosylcobinamide-GDP ribazoletransferase